MRLRSVLRRAAPDRVVTFADLYRVLEPGELLAGTDHPRFQAAWKLARADSFQPSGEAARGAVSSVAPRSAA